MYITFDKITNDFYKNLQNIRCIEVNDHKLNKILKAAGATFLPNKNFLVKTDEFINIKSIIY